MRKEKSENKLHFDKYARGSKLQESKQKKDIWEANHIFVSIKIALKHVGKEMIKNISVTFIRSS